MSALSYAFNPFTGNLDAIAGAGRQMVQRSFSSAITPWHWEHDLGTDVQVVCFELDGTTEKIAWPLHLDANTVEVNWYYPETGVIRLFY